MYNIYFACSLQFVIFSFFFFSYFSFHLLQYKRYERREKLRHTEFTLKIDLIVEELTEFNHFSEEA